MLPFYYVKVSLELEIVARSFEYMVFTKDGKFESRYEWLGIRD